MTNQPGFLPVSLLRIHRHTVALFASALVALPASAQRPRIVLPEQVRPGALVRVSLIAPSGGDALVSVRGEMSGEPLHFHKDAEGNWRAIGPVSPDASGEVRATIIAEHASRSADTLIGTASVPKPPPPRARRRALAVSPKFTQPLDAETQARIDRENAEARALGRRSHDTPRMWTAPFLRPRGSPITSPFGSGRMFNGTLTSRHLGVDFRGKPGDPIVAANRGIVALVASFFLAGNVVYIDHGDGIVTAYFHMSQPLVAAGDTVERGQKIGLVGATGRVTGPHLHWSARYGAITVNPLDLISLGRIP